MAGSDYTATSGMLTFNPGVTTQTVNVPILSDTAREPDETFTVTLTNPVNATLGASFTHTRSIYDNGIPGVAGLNAIAQAVDLLAWTFSTIAGANWWLQSAVAHDGVDAARSGFVADNQASSFQTTGSFGAGTVSFWWKVSSEPGADLLRFSIDGMVKDTISGEVGWQMKSYTVAAGSHTLKWEYTKNASGTGGIDAAWVDQLVLPAALVLWTRGDSGAADLWLGNTGTMPGAFAVTGQASIAVPTGVAGSWEATSCAHADASTDYVLWSRGDCGQAVLTKVNLIGADILPPAQPDTPSPAERASATFRLKYKGPSFSRITEMFRSDAVQTGVDPGTGFPALHGSDWACLSNPAGDGGPWQATSYSHQDAATGYVLWSRSDTGQAILAKVAPGEVSGTIPVTSWAYLDPPIGVGGPWQATGYTHVDASTGYVLWSRGDTGQAILWKVVPGEVFGTIPVASWAYLQTPDGVGALWQATSYTHIDTSEGYVLWTRADTGQAILWRVDPGEVSGTIPVTSWEYVSPREGVGGPWRATGYVHGATPRTPAATLADPGDESCRDDQTRRGGLVGEER